MAELAEDLELAEDQEMDGPEGIGAPLARPLPSSGACPLARPLPAWTPRPLPACPAGCPPA